MSFIGEVKEGTVYSPGYFLEHDEKVERLTREIPASLGTTTSEGGKYVKMGTIFPSNNGNATGIVYEDVDVTSGNMPGSVVTKGTVYIDRLPLALDSTETYYTKDADSYTAVASPDVSDIADYYEKGSDGTYSKTTDVALDNTKTYYTKDAASYTEVTDTETMTADGEYYTESGGSYTEASVVGIASAAKSALEALGFKFITASPAVTRPY